MRPTITSDDLCVANPLAYSFGDIDRFDLVVFTPSSEQRRPPIDEGVRYLKRVIGLPNEKLEVIDNRVFINDALLDESFEMIIDPEDPKRNFGPITIPENEYFLMGDNRPASEDGRYWKYPTVSKDNIHSKIVDINKDHYK